MRNSFNKIAVLIVLIVSSVRLGAEESGTDIVTYLNANSKGRVTVIAPEQLIERLKPENGNPNNGEPKKVLTSKVGYRIQVFSDNNATAKRDAQIKERNIIARYPQMRAYITYKAPSWRLRVGDFKTRDEATEMLKKLKASFPAYARELTVVVDRIN